MIRLSALATAVSAGVLFGSGSASAMSVEACEAFGGIVLLQPQTITQQPSPNDTYSIGKAHCVCGHPGDKEINNMPVYGLTWNQGYPGAEVGFYQCVMG